MAFTRNSYTVSEAGEVEVCVETRGVSERGYVPLTMETLTASELNIVTSTLHAPTRTLQPHNYYVARLLALALTPSLLSLHPSLSPLSFSPSGSKSCYK